MYNSYQEGSYGWAAFNAAMLAVDLTGVGALAKLGVNAGVKLTASAAKAVLNGGVKETIETGITKGLQAAGGMAGNVAGAAKGLADGVAGAADNLAGKGSGLASHGDDIANRTAGIYDEANNQLKVIQNECFARDTLVATPTGPRPIGEIKSGELVLAFDFNEGRWVARRVEERHDSEYIGALITLTTDSGTVQTTMYHPFWVLSGNELSLRSNPRELAEHEDEGLSLPGRWVNSHELRAGDVLIGQDGRRQRVLKLEQEYHEYFPVSNLTIQGDHTFAVGPDAILVHNTSGCLFGNGMLGKTPKQVYAPEGVQVDVWFILRV